MPKSQIKREIHSPFPQPISSSNSHPEIKTVNEQKAMKGSPLKKVSSTISSHRNLPTGLIITRLITVHARHHKNPPFMPAPIQSKLLLITRIKPRRPIPLSTNTEIIIARSADARGGACAFIEERVRVAGLRTGGCAFEVAGRVTIRAGGAVCGAIVALFARVEVPVAAAGW